MPSPNPHSIAHHFIKDVEHIPNTNDLWLAQATRAVKNPGKGEYMTVLLGPATRSILPCLQNNWSIEHRLLDGYRLRGYVKEWPATGYKIEAHSVVSGSQWVRQHRAEVFAQDFATARRLLIVLAKELVIDR